LVGKKKEFKDGGNIVLMLNCNKQPG